MASSRNLGGRGTNEAWSCEQSQTTSVVGQTVGNELHSGHRVLYLKKKKKKKEKETAQTRLLTAQDERVLTHQHSPILLI